MNWTCGTNWIWKIHTLFACDMSTSTKFILVKLLSGWHLQNANFAVEGIRVFFFWSSGTKDQKESHESTPQPISGILTTPPTMGVPTSKVHQSQLGFWLPVLAFWKIEDFWETQNFFPEIRHEKVKPKYLMWFFWIQFLWIRTIWIHLILKAQITVCCKLCNWCYMNTV